MTTAPPNHTDYAVVHADIVALLETARRAAARSVNAVMTATYWEVGRRIVEFEQGGQERAAYGLALLKRLSGDLSARFGRGFSERNLEQMRLFYLSWSPEKISQTASAKLAAPRISQTLSAKSAAPGNLQAASGSFPDLPVLARAFPLPWSAYVRLLLVKNPQARAFYETEALRGGWSIAQLNRQIGSQFFERTTLAKNKASMLAKGSIPRPEDAVTPDEAIKDPLVLEFLNLRDEYSETELEGALIHRLEDFLMELGPDFAFVGRQRRLRIDQTWYRVDLLFFHRRLRCLVIIDLKLTALTHADVGQMHMYCNYAKEHWTLPDENPPVGLILCADKGHALAKYALEGLPNKVMAANYQMLLPDAALLQQELEKSRLLLEARHTPPTL